MLGNSLDDYLKQSQVQQQGFGNMDFGSGQSLGPSADTGFGDISNLLPGSGIDINQFGIPGDEQGLTLMQKLFGGTAQDGMKTNGFISPTADLLKAGFGAFLGSKQLGIAEDQLDFTKSAFNKNYAAQKNTTNSQLAGMYERQDSARGTNTADEKMKQFGIA